MCHFITTTLPAGVDAVPIGEIANRWHRVWESMPNRHVLQQLRDGETHWLTTGGRCDCGTELGALRGDTSRTEKQLARDLERVRRKGWGEAKIARWLEEKQRSAARREADRQRQLRTAGSDALSWAGLLGTILDETGCANVGLLLHMYGGGVETERIELARQVDVPRDELGPEFLLQIEEDVLYRFQAV